MRLTNNRINALEDRVKRAKEAYRRGLRTVQIGCPHRSVMYAASGTTVIRTCASCGLSEYGPTFLILAEEAGRGIHQIFMDELQELQRGLVLTEVQKKLIADGNALVDVFDQHAL